MSLLKVRNFNTTIQPEEGDIALISFPLKDWGYEALHKESSHLGDTRYTELHHMYMEGSFFLFIVAECVRTNSVTSKSAAVLELLQSTECLVRRG